MGFIVEIDEIKLEEQEIESIEFISTMNEKYPSRVEEDYSEREELTVSLKINGKISAELGKRDETVLLSEWANPPSFSRVYHSLKITKLSNGKIIRQYNLPKVFAIDYFEDFDITTGRVTFSLFVRLRREYIPDLELSGE